ncbi:MAG: dTDP-4-dehydrorhamnose reductase [Halobacteria archaeon]|nr:dTDP-4-dehydrorhamnose reductase [Halobacteria archaeon]
MRVLVTGGDGQLGTEVVREFTRLGHEILAPLPEEMDFLDPDTLAARATALQADWVVNCAAYTQVDHAESEPGQAFTINRDSAGSLASVAAETGGRMMHISTDFVFDGKQSRPYREDDEPAPLSVYGRSKWEGDKAVLAALPGAIILRTAWVYGVHGNNFVKTMLRLAGEGKPLRVVDDQVGTPTWTADIVQAMVALVEADASGVFHFTNAGETSWCGFARAILAEAMQLGFEIKTRTVEAIPTSEYPLPATRPQYSVLDTRKIQPYLASPIPPWRDSLIKMLKELQACADCW